MGFGRNPYVVKAQDAELKAEGAEDVTSEVRAWLEAAQLWERAAAKEQPGTRRGEYEAAAGVAREKSQNPVNESGPAAAAVVHLRLVTEAGAPR